MSKPPRRTAVVLLLAPLAACREAPDEPRGGASSALVTPAPARTFLPAPAPAERPGARSFRPGLVPRPAIRPPPLLRSSGATPPAAIPPAPPTAEPAAGTGGMTPSAPPGNAPPATSAPPRESPVRRVEVRTLDAAQGEDGRGNIVPAVRPVAIDLHAGAWGGRGLAPVLLVGDLGFRRYQYPEPGVLRFVVAAAAALPAGWPAWLRWGDRERFRVAASLLVWEPSAGSDATGYRVERAPDPAGP